MNRSKVRDPKGNELVPMLLQVWEKDERGPTMLRVRRDDETIGLANEDQRTFWMVWAPLDAAFGEINGVELARDLRELKERQAALQEKRAEQDHAIASVERDLAALEEENRVKTEELRQLQKERDPDRVVKLVEEAAAARTTRLEVELARARGEIAMRDSEIAELRASKKKLKEANERLKEKK